MEKQRNLAKPGQYLSLVLNKEILGVPVATVREIVQAPDIRPVPNAPAWVQGVVDIRGKVIPVINLRTKFNMAKYEKSQSCIVVISGPHGLFGVIVDGVQEVVELKEGEIDNPPVFMNAHKRELITGIGKHKDTLIILVDLIEEMAGETLGSQTEFEIAKKSA